MGRLPLACSRRPARRRRNERADGGAAARGHDGLLDVVQEELLDGDVVVRDGDEAELVGRVAVVVEVARLDEVEDLAEAADGLRVPPELAQDRRAVEVELGDVGPVAAPRVDAHGPRRVHERRVRLGARVVVERVRVVDERAELRHLAPVQDLRACAEPLRRLQDLQRRREAPRLDAARAEDVRGDRELAPARKNQTFHPTATCAYSNGWDHSLSPCFENSTRAIDPSKNQPNRRRCDRAREFQSVVGTSRTGGRFARGTAPHSL